MKTVQKHIVGLCIFICLISINSPIKAQIFYGIIIAEEKILSGAGDKISQLIVANPFKVCVDVTPSINVRNVQSSRSINGTVRERFKEEYEYQFKQKERYINHHHMSVKYFSSYEDASRESKKIIAEYRNRTYTPVENHKILSVNFKDCFKSY